MSFCVAVSVGIGALLSPAKSSLVAVFLHADGYNQASPGPGGNQGQMMGISGRRGPSVSEGTPNMGTPLMSDSGSMVMYQKITCYYWYKILYKVTMTVIKDDFSVWIKAWVCHALEFCFLILKTVNVLKSSFYQRSVDITNNHIPFSSPSLLPRFALGLLSWNNLNPAWWTLKTHCTCTPRTCL